LRQTRQKKKKRKKQREREREREREMGYKNDGKSTSTSLRSCYLVKAHQVARDLIWLFQRIRAVSDVKFHDLLGVVGEMSFSFACSIANENDILPTTPTQR
jgi:transposase